MKICSVLGCEKSRVARSRMCSMHLHRLQRHGDVHYVPPTERERFASRLHYEQSSACWRYTGHISRAGYGLFGARDGLRHRTVLAHRFAYLTLIGPIPRGLQLDHLCCNKWCVNPAHLEPVTPGENTRRYHRALKEAEA